MPPTIPVSDHTGTHNSQAPRYDSDQYPGRPIPSTTRQDRSSEEQRGFLADKSVLVIDADSADAERLTHEFSIVCHRARALAPESPAIDELLVPFVPDIVVVDPSSFPKHTQEALVRGLHARFPLTAVAIVTSCYSLADCFQCARAGAAAYLPKPTSAPDVLISLSAYCSQPPQRPASPSHVLSLARHEWEHINRILAACLGNKTRAAQLLGIPRFSLQRKLRKNPPSR